jgi:hypothetical protein
MLALVVSGCKKKSRKASTSKRIKKGKRGRDKGPSINIDDAQAALLAAPWKGVVAGKPALLQFKVSKKRKTIWAVMMVGKKQHACRVHISRRGRISISTRGRPTSRGLTKLVLGGKLKMPITELSGKVSRSHKRGFMTSSSGIGDFQLVKGDQKTVASFLSSGCDSGNKAACYRLAVAYLRGDGVEKDAKKMVSYFEKGCVAGMLACCGNLGVIYYKGEAGIAKDEKKAKAYWSKACDDGYALGCQDLGHLYIKKKKTKKALRYYGAACAKKHAGGCNSYAWTLAQKGRGKTLDKALSAAQKAVKLAAKAEYIDTLAFVFYRRKDYVRAEIEAKRAIQMQPDNAEFKKTLAKIQKAKK